MPRKKTPEAPIDPKHYSKKDTKRWCKGVVGREHKNVEVDWMRRVNAAFANLNEGTSVFDHKWFCDLCTVCNKASRIRLNPLWTK